MPVDISYRFDPAADLLQTGPSGRMARPPGPQDAIRLLRLRIPERLPTTAPVPRALLTAPGSAGVPGGPAGLNALLQALIQAFTPPTGAAAVVPPMPGAAPVSPPAAPAAPTQPVPSLFDEPAAMALTPWRLGPGGHRGPFIRDPFGEWGSWAGDAGELVPPQPPPPRRTPPMSGFIVENRQPGGGPQRA